jgi:23S rRNA pseudoU1915 N3-methylase RlmH
LYALQPTMSFITVQTQRLVSALRTCPTTTTITFNPTRAFRATPTCGLQINIHIRGKRTGGEEFLNDAYLEYTKRLRPVLGLETIWHKTDEELKAAVAKEKAPVICLDERGKQLPSLELADVLYKRLEEGR